MVVAVAVAVAVAGAGSDSGSGSGLRSLLQPPAYSLQPSPYVAAGAAAAALVYFATMRLTRGMAASVCFLPMGRSFS